MTNIKISDVAEMAGVSRGTVDRVLHGRGHVDPAVEKRVQMIIKNLNYKPSRIAQQLSMRKRGIKLGLITRMDVNGFWNQIALGARQAMNELTEYGITIEERFFTRFLPEEQLAIINELVALGISGLVIVPLDAPSIRQRLKELMDAGIAVILVNSELPDFEPMCYVGSDYFISGQTSAGLLHLFANHQPVRLAICSGNYYLTSYRQRLEGFLAKLDQLQTNYEIVENIEITSDSEYAYNTTVGLLTNHPDINAVFTVSNNPVPVCKAIEDLRLTDCVIHIGYGMTPNTRPFLLSGALTATIGQQARDQGRMPFRLLLQYLLNGDLPEKKRILMRNEVFIRENCIF